MIVLVDFENTHASGLEGYEYLNENDTMVMYYSDENSSVAKGVIDDLKRNKVNVSMVKLLKAHANALDMYIASTTGMYLDSGEKICIVSKDKGYAAVADFWHSLRNAEILLGETIKECLLHSQNNDEERIRLCKSRSLKAALVDAFDTMNTVPTKPVLSRVGMRMQEKAMKNTTITEAELLPNPLGSKAAGDTDKAEVAIDKTAVEKTAKKESAVSDPEELNPENGAAASRKNHRSRGRRHGGGQNRTENAVQTEEKAVEKTVEKPVEKTAEKPAPAPVKKQAPRNHNAIEFVWDPQLRAMRPKYPAVEEVFSVESAFADTEEEGFSASSASDTAASAASDIAAATAEQQSAAIEAEVKVQADAISDISETRTAAQDMDALEISDEAIADAAEEAVQTPEKKTRRRRRRASSKTKDAAKDTAVNDGETVKETEKAAAEAVKDTESLKASETVDKASESESGEPVKAKKTARSRRSGNRKAKENADKAKSESADKEKSADNKESTEKQKKTTAKGHEGEDSAEGGTTEKTDKPAKSSRRRRSTKKKTEENKASE